VNAQRVTRGVEARDRKPKTVLEIQPADLAIGHYVEPNTFLQSDEFADARKLDCAKGIRSKRSIIETLACLSPALRPQQAAHHVGPDGA
jgi:hypothetical protein